MKLFHYFTFHVWQYDMINALAPCSQMRSAATMNKHISCHKKYHLNIYLKHQGCMATSPLIAVRFAQLGKRHSPGVEPSYQSVILLTEEILGKRWCCWGWSQLVWIRNQLKWTTKFGTLSGSFFTFFPVSEFGLDYLYSDHVGVFVMYKFDSCGWFVNSIL